MKRYMIAAVSIMVVLGTVLVCVGQEGERPAGRPERAPGRAGRGDMMRNYRETQQQALAAIEEEVKKIRAAIEMPAGERRTFGEMTEEQRTEMRERFTKMREDRQKSITAIEEQLAKLKGARTLTAEHDEAIAKLKALGEQAKKENATETAASIEKMVAEKEKAFDEMLKKLGMERSSGSGRGQRPRRPRGGEGGGEN